MYIFLEQPRKEYICDLKQLEICFCAQIMPIMKAVMVRQEAVKVQAVLYFLYIQLSNNLHFGTLNTDPSQLSFEPQMPAIHTVGTAVFVSLFEDLIVFCPCWLNKKSGKAKEQKW